MTELREEARRGPGQERRGRQTDEPARLDEVAEDALQASRGGAVAGLGGLGQDPRLLGVDDLVGAADVRPQLGQRVVQQAGVEVVAVDPQRLRPRRRRAATRRPGAARAGRRRDSGSSSTRSG